VSTRCVQSVIERQRASRANRSVSAQSGADAEPAGFGLDREAAQPCYHFATQLDGTRQNRLVWPQDGQCVLGPETLTKQHRQAGMFIG
jgi:hypothetical protein